MVWSLLTVTTTTTRTCWGPCPPQDVAPSFVPAWEPKQRLQRALPASQPACRPGRGLSQNSAELRPAKQTLQISLGAELELECWAGGWLAAPPANILFVAGRAPVWPGWYFAWIVNHVQPVRNIMDGQPALVWLSTPTEVIMYSPTLSRQHYRLITGGRTGRLGKGPRVLPRLELRQRSNTSPVSQIQIVISLIVPVILGLLLLLPS